MKRLIDWHLKEWKDYRFRKPLILRGARQVGKTYAVRKFGENFDNVVEINFEEVKSAKKIFEKDLVSERILNEVELLTGQKIVPGKTLLFLDEIQACPEAILALRYFYETMPSLHVIAAGSLLEFVLEKVGMPVGRVSSLYMYPLSFFEFLTATGHSLIAESILHHTHSIPISDIIHSKLLDLVGQYLAIGGIPEAVAKWVETKNAKESFNVHYELADAYRQDFQKYAKKHQIKYLDILFDQIPHLVGKPFKYTHIHGEYKKRELAPSLDLLCRANVVHKVHHSAGNGLPLGGEPNLEWFKLIFLDIALCQAIGGSDRSAWFLDPATTFVDQGSVVEAFIGQELLCYSMPHMKKDLYFWKRENKSSQAEVDYLYDYEGKILPIEAKSDKGTTLRSMHLFLTERPNSPYGIRFSAHNYSFIDKIDSRPLYAVCSLAHEEQIKALEFLVKK